MLKIFNMTKEANTIKYDKNKKINIKYDSNAKFSMFWILLSILCLIIAVIGAYLFNAKAYLITVICIGCNVFLWPIVYSKIHSMFIDLLEFTFKNAKGDKKKCVQEIYEIYMSRIRLKTFDVKLLYIGIIFCLNGWVWLQGNIFNNIQMLGIAYVAFFIITLIAAYSVIILLTVNIGMVSIVNNCNCYNASEYPNYADFIRKILDINSKIMKIITIIYIFLWIGVINGPFENLNIWIFIIMFGIGLMPLLYTIYNIRLKKLIIKVSLSNDVKEFEKKHLNPLYEKILKKPKKADMEEYDRLVVFRDGLIEARRKENLTLKFDLIISILTALIPIVWQIFCWFLSNK